MSSNQGKQFEAHIQKSFERVPYCVVHRLKDQIGKFKHVDNPCDFFFYAYPRLYCIECKSTIGASLSFTKIREKEQIDDLHDLITGKTGVVGGFIIWFKDKDETVFVRHSVIYNLYKSGAKSISLRYIHELPVSDWYLFHGTKKRVYYDYDVQEFFEIF